MKTRSEACAVYPEAYFDWYFDNLDELQFQNKTFNEAYAEWLNSSVTHQPLQVALASDDDSVIVECPCCKKPARRCDWETNHTGAENAHWSVSCSHCGYQDGTNDEELE